MTISTSPISPARRRRRKRRKARVEAAVEADHRGLRRVAATTSRHSRIRPASRSTGFSQKTALPARAARSISSAWSVGRGADHDGVDVAVLDDRVEVADMRAGRRRKRLRRRRARVGDRREPGPRMGGDIGAVDAPDPPGAEKPNPQHFPRSYSPQFQCRILTIQPDAGRRGSRERLIQVDRQVEL